MAVTNPVDGFDTRRIVKRKPGSGHRWNIMTKSIVEINFEDKFIENMYLISCVDGTISVFSVFISGFEKKIKSFTTTLTGEIGRKLMCFSHKIITKVNNIRYKKQLIIGGN